MKLNFNIPGWDTEEDLKILSTLAMNAHYDIVEVGSFLGRTSWHLAHNTKNTVHVFDPFKDMRIRNTIIPIDHSLLTVFDETQFISGERSYELFKQHTNDCVNISVTKGLSPHCVQHNITTDLVYIDDDHINPGFINNLKYWWDKLVDSGTMVLDDFNSQYLDVLVSTSSFFAEKNISYVVKNRKVYICKKSNQLFKILTILENI